MKILYVTTVGGTMDFFKVFISDLIKQGHQVDIATNRSNSHLSDYFTDLGCKIYDISTSRSPFSFGNVKAIKQIKSIAKDYDIIHCHTPLAGMATRLACRPLRKKNNLKVIYTAHGFHFYKGAPKKNWLIYYPIERYCSKFTDALIVINTEDYEFAKRKMKTKNIYYVPGVGIDVNSFKNHDVDKQGKRKEIGVPESSFVILSVGELNTNKNHQIVIKAISRLKDTNIHYVIAGVGDQNENLINLSKELSVNLHLLGFRKDVRDLYKIANLYVLPSIREGLNVSVMEAMASGCPVIASDIRGNRDMVLSKNLFNPMDDELISKLISGKQTENSDFVSKIDYSLINKDIIGIYQEITK